MSFLSNRRSSPEELANQRNSVVPFHFIIDQENFVFAMEGGDDTGRGIGGKGSANEFADLSAIA